MTATGQKDDGKALLTLDQYMDLLLSRQAEYAKTHPPVLGFPPLPTWFIRDGDEDLVDMTAVEAYPHRTTPAKRPAQPKKPRYYKPASHWQDIVERTQRRMDSINGIQRHDTTDPAAYGGVGVRQTARQNRRHWDCIDKAAAEYVRLEKRLSHAKAMLRKAIDREAAAATPGA